MTEPPPRPLRRFFAIVTGGLVGVVLGAAAMLASQDPDPGLTPITVPPATEAPVETTPILRNTPEVLLAWTPGELDPALAYAAGALGRTDTVSIVRSGLADMVASRDAAGNVIDEPDPGWFVPLETIAVDPAAHAELAPAADRLAVAGLADDEALLTRSSAALRRMAPGDTLELDGGHELTVTGIVEDATVGAAEVAVNLATGAAIGIDTPRYMLLVHRSPRAEVEATLRGVMPDGLPVRFRAPGETPFLREEDALLPPIRIKEQFGEFAYRPPADRAASDDFQQEIPWQEENLVHRDLPLIGPVRCHRAVIEALEGALHELQASGLQNLIEPEAFKGCWNPRFVRDGDDISRHAWGVAIDLNYDDNPTGLESVQDPRLVEIFERWGFTWGGSWPAPDAGHFEWAGSASRKSGPR